MFDTRDFGGSGSRRVEPAHKPAAAPQERAQRTAALNLACAGGLAALAPQVAHKGMTAPASELGRSGNFPMVFRTAGQLRREAAAKAAQERAQKQGVRTLTAKSGDGRTVASGANLPNLSSNALKVLQHLIDKWHAAGAKPVQYIADDAAGTLNLRIADARAALRELKSSLAVVEVRDTGTGETMIMPAPHILPRIA